MTGAPYFIQIPVFTGLNIIRAQGTTFLSVDVKNQLCVFINTIKDERKSEEAHIPLALTLLDNAAQNEWQ